MRRALRPLPFVSAVCSLTAAIAAGGQAPLASATGDPTVRDDTIYRLVVDPRAYTDQPFVYLLDDGVARFEKDGSGWTTWRQVVQLLTPESLERWGELSLRYEPDREQLSVNWVRVLDSTGRPISTPPLFQRDQPLSESGAEGDAVAHRITVGGLQVGTILDYSYTVTRRASRYPMPFYQRWRVATGQQVQRSRFLVNLWLDADPHIAERHLTFDRVESIRGDRHIYLWATHDVRKVDRELFAPDSSYEENVTISSPLKWIDVSKMFAQYLEFSDLLHFEKQQELSSALQGAVTRTDTLRRLYDWSATAPYCVRGDTAARSTTGRPFCSDRGIIMVAAARWLGFKAYPVVAGLPGAVDSAIPGYTGLGTVLAAVQEREDEFRFFDPTARRVRFGELPDYEEGQFGLLVWDDGEYTKVQLPVPPPSANASELVVAGNIDGGGRFSGEITLRARGRQRAKLRTMLRDEHLADSLGSFRCFAGFGSILARVDSGGGTSDSADAPITVSTPACGEMVSDAGGTLLLEIPLLDLSGNRELALVNSAGARTMPIDAGRLTGNFEIDERLELALPPGWRMKLPSGTSATSPFGNYVATYTLVHQKLIVERRLTGASGVYPASDWPSLLTWLRARAKDDTKVLVIER